jgi:hypothetical protein
LGGPHGRRLEVHALVVDTLEQYYRVPQGSMWKWQMQLGIEDDEILPLLQVAQPGDRHWGNDLKEGEAELRWSEPVHVEVPCVQGAADDGDSMAQ